MRSASGGRHLPSRAAITAQLDQWGQSRLILNFSDFLSQLVPSYGKVTELSIESDPIDSLLIPSSLTLLIPNTAFSALFGQ